MADVIWVTAGTAALLAGAALAVAASRGGAERMLDLLAPDAYWTNVSINGFVSRLVLSTDRTAAVAPVAFDPRLVTALATGVVAGATLVVLWRARARLGEPRTLALAVGFALLAGVIGAPKNSFWNTSLSLVTLGLLLAAEASGLLAGRRAPITEDRPPAHVFDGTDRLLLTVWVAGFGVQTLVWTVPPPPTIHILAPAVTLAGSSALYGMLALWWLIARRLAPGRLTPSRLAATSPTNPIGVALS
jgi:hypothetical protein